MNLSIYKTTTTLQNNTVMKTVLKNQKRVSAIVALALAGMVTFMAGINSYGVTSTDYAFDFDEQALMERAIADLEAEEFVMEEEAYTTIKIYNEQNELIESVMVGEGELIEDEYTQQLLNQAEFLSSYNSTMVYQVSE